MQKNFLDQAEIVMIGMAGDFVHTEHSATKDVVSINYQYARFYVYMNSNRFNRDFKDEILKRKTAFLPHMHVKELDDQMFTDLRTRYKAPDQASRKEKEEVWDKVQELKKFSRNEAGAFYEKEKKKVPSGTYNDEGILKDIIQ